MKPWTEKYRPTTLDDVVGHTILKRTLKSFMEQKNYPHILLHGPQGSGKTATIKAFLRDFYGNEFSYNVIEHNASDDRKIEFIRTQLKKECSAEPSGEFQFRTIFLCEIDNLTKDAQFALRRTMETYSRKVRFIADCNEVNKLIKPIRSRFAEYFVPPLGDKNIKDFIAKIYNEENLWENKDMGAIVDYIIKSSKGDLRSAVNFLQSISHLDEISLQSIKELNPYPDDKKVKELIEANKNGATFQQREQILQEVVRESGNQCDAILEQIYEWYLTNYEGEFKPHILLDIGDYLNRMGTLYVPNVIQLRSCLERLRQIG